MWPPPSRVTWCSAVQTYECIAKWRDRAMEGMAATPKSRTDDPKIASTEAEKKQLQGKLGEVVMENELLLS